MESARDRRANFVASMVDKGCRAAHLQSRAGDERQEGWKLDGVANQGTRVPGARRRLMSD
ncbi:hypothetical protein GGP41_006303 [Bipolaris sorokiniana]|uniref:Uncharacterized protein n=1 Tax=Cochliobolus sativus TaxID=45130 RepID=A0A8H6DVF3_COCSA|nr:hypothetical protein GGP41_006303 [Bipolaris sorokiniana]